MFNNVHQLIVFCQQWFLTGNKSPPNGSCNCSINLSVAIKKCNTIQTKWSKLVKKQQKSFVIHSVNVKHTNISLTRFDIYHKDNLFCGQVGYFRSKTTFPQILICNSLGRKMDLLVSFVKYVHQIVKKNQTKRHSILDL